MRKSLGFQQKAAEAGKRDRRWPNTSNRCWWHLRSGGFFGRGKDGTRPTRAAQLQQVEALRSALSLANLRYKGGLANYLDVLIAQRNLFDAELALMGTHRLHLVSIVPVV